MPALVLFDDPHPLAPLTDLRASFELRTGALATWQRLETLIGRQTAAIVVSQTLAPLLASRYDGLINRLPDDDEILLINGRWAYIDAKLPIELNTAVVDDDGSVAGALVDREHAQAFIDAGCELNDDIDVEPRPKLLLLNHPWDILKLAPKLLEFDLSGLCQRDPWQPDPAKQQTIIGDGGVSCGQQVRIMPHVVFDTTHGPIVIDDQAVIQPMVTIVGPCYIGVETEIAAHAYIRMHTSIGPRCKIGGEVKASIFQGYTNKAHYGYVGNSYIGEWANLGAGTTTSNLKNTYGDINMQLDPDGGNEPTGLRCLGSIIGDYVRTAIGSRLLTGSCLHTGAMVAVSDLCPKYVAPFAFLTDELEDRHQLEKFALVADRMMQRRHMRVTAELAHRIAHLYMI